MEGEGEGYRNLMHDRGIEGGGPQVEEEEEEGSFIRWPRESDWVSRPIAPRLELELELELESELD